MTDETRTMTKFIVSVWRSLEFGLTKYWGQIGQMRRRRDVIVSRGHVNQSATSTTLLS